MRFRYYRHCSPITKKQRAELERLARPGGWSFFAFTTNCSSFASEVFFEVTGKDIDADDFAGAETPRELGESIYELDGEGSDVNKRKPSIGATSSASKAPF